MMNTDGLNDEELIELAAQIIDELDAIEGDSDFEADCDEPAPREWRIGALIRRSMHSESGSR